MAPSLMDYVNLYIVVESAQVSDMRGSVIRHILLRKLRLLWKASRLNVIQLNILSCSVCDAPAPHLMHFSPDVYKFHSVDRQTVFCP